jgi:hypothetical protein
MSHLNSFILFQNDSVHAVFKDKSSLIVHPDQSKSTFLYFQKQSLISINLDRDRGLLLCIQENQMASMKN